MTIRDRHLAGQRTRPITLPYSPSTIDLEQDDFEAGEWLHNTVHELEIEIGLREG